MGTWAHDVSPDILDNLNDQNLWSELALIDKIRGEPRFNHICYVHFNYLVSNWDFKLYKDEFRRVIKMNYGPNAEYGWTPINIIGRRYRIYNCSNFKNKKILWECDVYPK